MATFSQTNHRFHLGDHADTNTQLKAARLAVPVGRTLFALIFILSGLNHFDPNTIAYAAKSGVMKPEILVPLSGVLAIAGGLSVLLGFATRIGALLLIAFLVPVTLMMHNFWTFSDPMAAQMQMGHFMKNLSMTGGAMLLAFYGAGPVSIDNLRAKHGQRR